MQDLKKTIESKFTNNHDPLCVAFLGRLNYESGLLWQQELLNRVQNSNKYYVIGLEHPDVITLGYRAKAEEEILAGNTLPVQKIARGGFATLHSTGQLVIYPVLNLRELKLGVRDYIYCLLQTTQSVLSQFSVSTYIDDGAIGLYTQKGKISFCGIQVKNGITQHGLSLNVSNDLSLFQTIRSCGIDSSHFDRLQDHGIECSLTELFALWIIEFQKNIKF